MNQLTEKLVEAVKDCFSERGIALHVSTDDLTTAIRSVLGQEVLYTKKEVIELAKKEYRESFGSLNNYPPKQFNGYSLSGLISSALDCNTDTPPTT